MGNYVKVVQRVPVKIIFDEPADLIRIRPRAGHVGRSQRSGSNERAVASACQSLVDRLRGDAGDVHGSAGHFHRLGRAALHRGQPRRDAVGSDVGADQLSGLQRHCAAGQRLAFEAFREETAFDHLHHDFFGFFLSVRGGDQPAACSLSRACCKGAGGGALQPLAQSIMLESFPPAKRGTAMAVYGIGVVCAPILGPTLGGWLTDTWSWRWAFYINVPVSILAVFMISLFVGTRPGFAMPSRGRIDGVGLGFMALGLGTLQILLDKGQEVDWFGAVWMRWMAGISAASLLFFIWWELRVSDPIVNLRILKNRNFAVACGLFFLFGAAIYGLVTLQPLFLQTLLGYTALEPGLTVTPRGVGAFFALFVVGALISRLGGRRLAAFGFVVFSLGAYIFSGMSLQMARSTILLPNLVSGFGAGFIFVPLTTVGLATLRNDQIGNAAGHPESGAQSWAAVSASRSSPRCWSGSRRRIRRL